MTRFRSAALAAFACAALATPSARAAVEAHETARDVRIRVEENGAAHVDETLHFRLLYAGWKGLDLPGLEADAAPEGEATITSVEGGASPANLTVLGPGTLRLDALDAKGLKKGDYAAHFSYRVDLVANHEVARDGALWRLTWTSAAPLDGVDGMRVVFDLPAAPTEPSAADADGENPGFLSTLRRSEQMDEIDLVRPHVARGEAATWSVRIDPKALPEVRDPVLRPPPPPRVKDAPDPFADARLPLRAMTACLLGLLFLATGFAKLRTIPRKFSAKSLLPVAPLVALAPAAATYGAGIWFALTGAHVRAVLAFALATSFAIVRAGRRKPAPRGPGSWKAIAEHKALARRPSVFDLSYLRGRIALLVLVACAVSISFAARPLDPDAWLGVAPAMLPWLVFWLSGTRASFADIGASAIALRPIFLALRHAGARVTAWARVPLGRKEMDDLRLLVVPDTALPGLVGIEVAVGWLGLFGGFSPRFEVLVRARDASAAAAKMGSLAKAVRACTGRRAEERVYVLEPRGGDRESVIELVMKSADWLVDRRLVSASDWAGDERRKPLAPWSQAAVRAA